MIRIGIVGATGYTGEELLRLLSLHDSVEVAVVTSNTRKGELLTDVFPSLGQFDLSFVGHDSDNLYSCDLVFFATPNATAMHYIPALIEQGCRVIDLSADFMIQSPEIWQRWYKQKHACPELLKDAVYGLPEFNRDLIIKANLIANPGCYPTAIVLGLLPAIKNGLIDTKRIIANAVSGVSGAGRKAVLSKEFSDFTESFKAYGVFTHRHLPEISQILNDISLGDDINLVFTPHLVPMHRGIHATIYVDTIVSKDEIRNHYTNFYLQEKFVDVLSEGSCPETKTVKMTNMCNIGFHFNNEKPRKMIILSVIDNLIKGAAGQAIQNMNLMFGFDEERGLILPESNN
jgi:N-acetyl-gamma-glutamyl-phosphate reductase